MGRGKRKRSLGDNKRFFRNRYIGRLPDELELPLYGRLLADDKTTIVMPKLPEEKKELAALIERDDFLPAEGVLLFKMESRECHRNASDLWLSGREPDCRSEVAGCCLMSGYALSDDNKWRQHSWVATSKGQIIETTTPRTRYFGYKMDAEEAEQFAFSNWP